METKMIEYVTQMLVEHPIGIEEKIDSLAYSIFNLTEEDIKYLKDK